MRSRGVMLNTRAHDEHINMGSLWAIEPYRCEGRTESPLKLQIHFNGYSDRSLRIFHIRLFVA